MKIKSIKHRLYQGSVFNIGTPPHHNYFANGALVHNCYQASTSIGKHARGQTLTNIIDALALLKVFEVAFGGGEPTLYEDKESYHAQTFPDLLEYTRKQGITPNFTTKNPAWLHNPEVRKKILENIGGFAYSTNSVQEVRDFMNLATKYEVDEQKISIQFVVGAHPIMNLIEIVEFLIQHNVRLTLLGFKTVGFGETYVQVPNSTDWVTVLKDVYTRNGALPQISIDTALAQQSVNEMTAAGIPTWCYSTIEGEHSMYIDAVERKIGPSSYCKQNEMVKLTDNTLLDHRKIAKKIQKVFPKW